MNRFINYTHESQSFECQELSPAILTKITEWIYWGDTWSFRSEATLKFIERFGEDILSDVLMTTLYENLLKSDNEITNNVCDAVRRLINECSDYN